MHVYFLDFTIATCTLTNGERNVVFWQFEIFVIFIGNVIWEYGKRMINTVKTNLWERILDK